MSGRLNPSEYDVGELRRAAEARAGPLEASGTGTGSRDAARERVYESVGERELTAPAAARERPFLDELPDSTVGVRTAYEWLDFLQRRVGADGTREALSYYQRVGWLSTAAEAQLDEHLTALNPALSRTGSLADLDVDDHRLSYDYVTKLSAFAGRERDDGA